MSFENKLNVKKLKISSLAFYVPLDNAESTVYCRTCCNCSAIAIVYY